jgi:predicted permease
MKFLRQIRGLFRRRTFEAEMAEEMRLHLEQRIEENIASGMTPEDARYAARRKFGGETQFKERCREQRAFTWIDQTSRDVHYAVKQLRHSPGFTAVALLTLALGIGLNTSMFGVLNALFLRTLPYPQPGELVRVFRSSQKGQLFPHSPANFSDLRAQSRSFAAMAAFDAIDYNLAAPGQPAQRLRGLSVTGDFFAVLGMAPEIGRVFGADEDRPGHNGVVVLSHTFWQGHFGSDPAIVGRDIRLDGENVTVIGVMPRAFEEPLVWGPLDAWRPFAFDAKTLQSRGDNWLGVVGRLKPSMTIAGAEAEVSSVAAQLAKAYPMTNAQTTMTLLPLAAAGQDSTVRQLTWFTLGLAGCVLLIACVNLANLQFARNLARGRELAVRAALGATRFRLVRQSLTESLLLAAIGGALGLAIARWSNDALGSRLQLNGGSAVAIVLDWRVLGFAFAVAAFTGVAFGLLPAWLAARTNVNDALKQGGRSVSGSRTHHRIRHSLIVGEVALALVLLSGAGFFLRGLQRFVHRDLGWRPDHLLTASITLPGKKYATDDAQRAFYDRLERRLAALPGVERVALSLSVPLSRFNWGQRFIVEGQPEPKPGAEPRRDVNGVTLGYFDTLGIGLIQGRFFTASDLSGPTRTVINETMAREIWPGQNPIGKRIAHPFERGQWQEVIGVVRDVRFPATVDRSQARFQTYRLLARESSPIFSVTVRSAIPPEALADMLRRAVSEIDPDQSVQDILPASQVIEQGLANLRLCGALLGGFAALGPLLAAVGIYGVIAGFVVQRTEEIGLRIALGAQLRDILRMVLGQGLRFALFGAVVGLAGAAGVARVLGSIVPALPPAEGFTAGAVTVTLLAVALFACWLPAWRATKVDPMIALRSE